MTMTLNELRSVWTVGQTGLSISRTAEVLHASQPGISRHVIEVEDSLGVRLFVRSKNRLVGLTPVGELLLPQIGRILGDVDDLKRIAGQHASGESGSLSVATSHTHARYVLPEVIQAFIAEFPKIDLRIRQAHVDQIAEWVSNGEADLSVAAPPVQTFPELALHRFGEMRRIALAPQGHPLLAKKRPTLQDLARWPIITYERGFVAYTDIMGTFDKAHLQPRVVLSTGDTDVMKIYVQSGLGIALVSDHAFDPVLDRGLGVVNVRRLFPATPMYIGVKKGRPLSSQALRFIELVAPGLRLANLNRRPAR